MQYTYTTEIKRRDQKPVPLSVLCGNKKAVASLLDSISAYIGKSRMEVKLSLMNVEVGNLVDLEKFARIVNYQLADLINEMNQELMKARVKSLTSNDVSEAENVQNQFMMDFCKILQKDNDLKNIIIKYLRLVISRLGQSSSPTKTRIARQLKITRKALIIDDWQKFLQVSSKINKIENENYQILTEKNNAN